MADAHTIDPPFVGKFIFRIGALQIGAFTEVTGLGVSILPSSVRAVRGDKVAVLPLARHVPVVETALVRRRDEPPAPPARHLLRLALSTPEPDMLAPELAPARTGRDAAWRWSE